MKPQKLFFLSIILFAFFPILPNRVKGLPVIIFFFMKQQYRSIKVKEIGYYVKYVNDSDIWGPNLTKKSY